MKKKLFIFLSISFLVFLWTLYFYQKKQKKVENYVKKIETVSTKLEQKELSWVNLEIEKNITDSAWTWNSKLEDEKKMLEKMIANQLVDIDDLRLLKTKSTIQKKYQLLYVKEMKKNNIHTAIKAVKKLLKYTKNKEIWYEKIVDLYIKIGDYKNAELYSEKLIKLNPTKKNLRKYLYLRFQTLNIFDNKQIESLKVLVSLYYQKWIIDSSELSFYNFLIELFNWDIENIKILLTDMVKTTKDPLQKQFLISVQHDLKVYESKKWTSLIYFKALVALDLLKFSYFWLAKSIAEKIYLEDDSYILPIQIMAYSYFFMWDYKNAVKYFQILKNDFDDENQDDYTFFIWVSYYWLGDYENSLLFLSQLKDNYAYALDVLRYKFLDYLNLKDKDNIIKTIHEMIYFPLTYTDYYNIFKYMLLQCNDCYNKNTKLIIDFIKRCYKDVDKKNEYVCWFGKAYLYDKFGKKKRAALYFKLLTKYFQDPYIYDSLAKYYLSRKNTKIAKHYYLKELLYTSNEEKRKNIKEKIKEIILKKQEDKEKNEN